MEPSFDCKGVSVVTGVTAYFPIVWRIVPLIAINVNPSLRPNPIGIMYVDLPLEIAYDAMVLQSGLSID